LEALEVDRKCRSLKGRFFPVLLRRQKSKTHQALYLLKKKPEADGLEKI